MNRCALLFLSGRPLARRALWWDGAQSPELGLIYGDPSGSGSSPNPEWIGYADGARSRQPLARLDTHADGRPDRSAAGARRVVWCGDADSIPESELRAMMAGALDVTERHHLPQDKSMSDGAVLMERCLADAPSGGTWVVEIIGALGGRRDHEIVNLAEIRHVFFGEAVSGQTGSAVLSQRACVVIVQPSLIVANVPVSIRGLPPGLPLTVLVSQPSLPVALGGLRYSGTFGLERPSQGLSNVVEGDTVHVEPLSGAAAAEGARASWRCPGACYTVVIGHDESCYFV